MYPHHPSGRKKIVLLVENNLGLLEANADALQQQGYTVLKAASQHEALALLEDRWLHLLVIDTRLRDEEDLLDISGIELAREPALQIYPRIIYTGYLKETAHQLIQEALGTLPPGVRVHSKRDQEQIGTIVDRAFVPQHQGSTGQVGINFEQSLIYPDGLSTLSLVGRLRDVPIDGETIVARIGEIEDLLGKAFAGCETLRIAPITAGRGGGFVLIVTPEQDQLTQRSQIVKCGPRQAVAREYSNYQEHVRNFVDFAAHLTEDRPIETLHFGLLKYNIANGDIDETLTFAEFYRRNPAGPIRRTVRNLFAQTLSPWQRGPNGIYPLQKKLYRFYEERLLFPRRKQTADFATLWDLLGVAIRRAIRDTPYPVSVRSKNGLLQWTIDDRTFELPNPHQALASIRAGNNRLFSEPTLACRCHGDLHVENIRVNDDMRVWLIDFDYTGFGPLLQDAVELEASILLGLITDRRIDCLLQLIEVLASQTELDQLLMLPETLHEAPEIVKAFEVIVELRNEAGKIEGACMEEYLLGLIYHGLRVVNSERPPSWADMRKLSFYKTLALFLASVCCRTLAQLDAALGPPASS